MEKPRPYTVIIPSFNRRGVLSRSISSVQQQTLPAQEILIIDDGSTDGTAEALAREKSSAEDHSTSPESRPAAVCNTGY